MSAGAMYLNARYSATEHRFAAKVALADGHNAQARRSIRAAHHYSAKAAELRTQLHASRRLGLGGSAGALPRNYHGDSQTGSAIPHSALRNPQS